jgi:hypothetical protein
VSFSAFPVAFDAGLLGVVFLAAVAPAVVDSLDFTATFFSGVFLAGVLLAGDLALVADLVAAVLVVLPVVAVLFAAVPVAVFLTAVVFSVPVPLAAPFTGALAVVPAVVLPVLAPARAAGFVVAAGFFAAGLLTGLAGVAFFAVLAAAPDRAGAAFLEAVVAMVTTPCTGRRRQIRTGRRQ